MPERIQRKRTKGWRTPDGAVYVGRPSRWGNPFTFVARPDGVVVHYGPTGHHCSFPPTDPDRIGRSHRLVVAQFERVVREEQWDLTALVGRDLACWCPLDRPCHADVLLRLSSEVLVDV